jgi:hypothetical protein
MTDIVFHVLMWKGSLQETETVGARIEQERAEIRQRRSVA